MASFGIGAKLRQARVGKGLAIDDISRLTRITPRFLEAIETDDYSSLPGLLFTRNFVRQYALALQLDPDPFLADLPKPDESTAPLPNPPSRPRSSYRRDRRLRSIATSFLWLVLAASAGAAYMFFIHKPRATAAEPRRNVVAPALARKMPAARASAPAAPVRVSLTAREAAWVQVSADGRIAFIGTLHPHETKDVSAAEQVKVLTGNAGGLTISLNGKTLESIGPSGQVRVVRLTAEGPLFPSKDSPPAPDPL